MTLPKTNKPTFEIKVPSQNDRLVVFRPFLVREEKVLLIAQQSDNDRDIVRALGQVIDACSQDESLRVEDLATFDVEYLFLKLRSKSVDNVVELKYRDTEDDQVRTFTVDLDQVEVERTDGHTNVIDVDGRVGIKMRYPSVQVADSVPDGSATEVMDHLVANCIDSIFDEEQVYPAADYTREELMEFVDGLDVATYDKIRQFFATMPKMTYTIEYTNSLGTERKIELTGLRDFFSWG